MSIKIGNINIADIRVGDIVIGKVYKGNDLVYNKNKFIIEGTAIDEFTINFYPIKGGITKNDMFTINVDDNKFAVKLNIPDNKYNGLLMGTNKNNIKTITKLYCPFKVDHLFNLCINCTNLEYVNISDIDASNIIDVSYTFNNCSNLKYLDISNIKNANILEYGDYLFDGCNNLNHIKCTQSFKNWCLTHSETMLPNTMKDGGSGTWEIVN